MFRICLLSNLRLGSDHKVRITWAGEGAVLGYQTVLYCGAVARQISDTDTVGKLRGIKLRSDSREHVHEYQVNTAWDKKSEITKLHICETV